MTLMPDGESTGWQKTQEWWQLKGKKGGAIRDFSPAGRKVFGDQTNTSINAGTAAEVRKSQTRRRILKEGEKPDTPEN